MTRDDLLESMVNAAKFHEDLLNYISLGSELLHLSYNEIREMPLKDFKSLLRIKGEEAKRKQEYLQQQQQASMQSLNSKNKKISFK